MSDPFAPGAQPWFTDPSGGSSAFQPLPPQQQQQQHHRHVQQPQAFMPSQPFVPATSFTPNYSVEGGKLTSTASNFDDEPPLLVELGINFSSIARMADGDLAAPLVFCLVMGFFLMLTGKLHFGYVFGFAVSGSMALWVVLNLMTPRDEGIRLHVVVSVLGYALIPIVGLAGVAVFVSLRGPLGYVLVPGAVGWCTLTATRFFEAALAAREQRYLIAYPSFLLYACFALIAVF